MKYVSQSFVIITTLMTASRCWLGCSTEPECDIDDQAFDLAECDMDDQQLDSTTQALQRSSLEPQTAEISRLKLDKTCDRYLIRPRWRSANGDCPSVRNWTGSEIDSSGDGFCYYVWNGTDILGPSSSELNVLASYAIFDRFAQTFPINSFDIEKSNSNAVGAFQSTGIRYEAPSNTETEQPSRSRPETRLPPGLHPACFLASPESVQHFDFSTMGAIYSCSRELYCVSHGMIWEDGGCFENIAKLSNGQWLRRQVMFLDPGQSGCTSCIHVFDQTMTGVGLPRGAMGEIWFQEAQGGGVTGIQVPKDAEGIFTMPLPAAPAGDYWVEWVAHKEEQPLPAVK